MSKMKIINHLFLSILVCSSATLNAKENINQKGKVAKTSNSMKVAASCSPATAATDLEVNNVRARIMTGGDMWWDLVNNAQYEIPRGSGKTSMFSGALWIGGLDQGGQLKVAAMTYRQTGNDFWPGPMDTTTTSIDMNTCAAYDKLYSITRTDVEDYAGWLTSPADYPNVTGPSQAILEWPANGDAAYNQGHYLAPFYDADGDGYYDPNSGDYPGYDLDATTGVLQGELYGDQTLWWVFNDVGNIHTETGAEPIGLEIQAQAFGFATNDEINNMTFYNYKIINRSSYEVQQCYFGQWVDADLGYYLDDYVGCDVARGLGYCYNGDSNDDEPTGYGENPPSIGVDFFQGPVADANDGLDNDRDSVIDEAGEQIIMSKFVYYNNDFSTTGNPETGTHVYNYLRGMWKDGTSMTYDGNGYGGTLACDFMFPGSSDPTGIGTGGVPQSDWSEETVGNTPADRRFLQSAGPFTLQPGAVNTITVGVVWAQASSGGASASVDLMKLADDKAQALFDNNFKVLNGPDAPDIDIRELNQSLVFYITNKTTSNNYGEKYEEKDPLIIWDISTDYDTTYNFEGYQVYQLADATVSVTDLQDPDKAVLVFQCDVENDIDKLVNYTYDSDLEGNVPVKMVDGNDEGVEHSFVITEDQFATGNKTLVNNKQYHFLALAYSYNSFKEYNQSVGGANLDGQKIPYLAGRKNIKTYTAIPHIVSPENGGTVQNADYGTGPQLTRIEGRGNGGMVLELTDETVNAILASGKVDEPTYQNSAGPVNIKVVDPLNVPVGNYELRFDGDDANARWTLTNLTEGITVSSDTTIGVKNEQLILDWGLAVTALQTDDVGEMADDNNGFIEASMEFDDDSKQWLSGVPDIDGEFPFNWIRSGTFADVNFPEYDDYIGDSVEAYEKVIVVTDPSGTFSGGTWAPYKLTSQEAFGTAFNYSVANSLNKLENTASIDVVITSDQSKWTKCVVIEMCDDNALSEGNVDKFHLRAGTSKDKDGNDTSGTGMSWFPGYAINVETGERLNIMFGENSFMIGDNGNDMIWNPTLHVYNESDWSAQDVYFGGMHAIYIMGHNSDDGVPAYDEGAFIYSKLSTGNQTDMRYVYKDAMWVTIPIASEEDFLSTDVKIRLRVKKPYTQYSYASTGVSNPVNSDYPMYTFSTSDIATDTGSVDAATSALDLMRVVPNPYYAYSDYETNQLDNRVKLTNLPRKCTISIYTMEGRLIRQFDKDQDQTYLDWDLKNSAGISISSGMYLLHIDVPGVGERTLKMLAVMRPIDLDSY